MKDYYGALKDCQIRNGSLASVLNQDENDFIKAEARRLVNDKNLIYFYAFEFILIFQRCSEVTTTQAYKERALF